MLRVIRIQSTEYRQPSRSSGEQVLFAANEICVTIGNVRRLLIAIMKIKAITQSKAAAGGNGVIAFIGRVFRVGLEIMLAEGIGAEQAVVARHPPGRMPEILRVIKNGD